jgi:hypothetical protein
VTRYANLYPAPNEMNLGVIRAAWPTAAWQIKATALTTNWLFSRGTPLAVDGGHAWVESGEQTRRLRYRYQVDDVHVHLALALTCSMTPAFGTGSTFLPITLGTVPLAVGTEPKVIQIPLVNIGGNTEASIDLDFAWDGDVGALLIHQLIMYECPTVLVENTGVEIIERGDMIWDGYDDRQSIAGLERAVNDLRDTYYRRGALFNWASGYSAGVTSLVDSFVALHPDGIKPAIQTRLMYTGETVRSVACAVFAAGFGEVRVTMSSGDSHTFTVDNGYSEDPGDWFVSSVDVETDDPDRWSIDGGIRGGDRDEITIEYKADTGEAITLFAVSMWDPPGG